MIESITHGRSHRYDDWPYPDHWFVATRWSYIYGRRVWRVWKPRKIVADGQAFFSIKDAHNWIASILRKESNQ